MRLPLGIWVNVELYFGKFYAYWKLPGVRSKFMKALNWYSKENEIYMKKTSEPKTQKEIILRIRINS